MLLGKPNEKPGTKISKSDIKDIKKKPPKNNPNQKKTRKKPLCKQIYLVKKLFCKMHWKSYFVL